jgi:hypothetical protein
MKPDEPSRKGEEERAVADFTKAMLRKLRANSHKGHWHALLAEVEAAKPEGT